MFKILNIIVICSIICAKKETKNTLKISFGLWSEWSPWTKCLGPCGHTGRRHRDRVCNTRQPCHGPPRQTVSCHRKGCKMKEYEELIGSDKMKLDQLKIIKMYDRMYPSLTQRCVETECSFQLVYQTLLQQADIYWSVLHCLKHGSGCPVRGGWSEWGEWSDCSSYCGSGQRISCRSCDRPRPSNKHYMCLGKRCTMKSCSGERCHQVQGKVWSVWSPWSGCSQSCGFGFRIRRRQCSQHSPPRVVNTYNSIRIKRSYVDKSQSINGIFKNSSSHNPSFVNSKLRVGPVQHLNGTKSQKKFGPNNRIHSRFIKNVKSNVNIYRACLGAFKEIESCFLMECYEDGGWSEWTEWSECSKLCGPGVRVRSRPCSSPQPSPPTNLCHGSRTETDSCYNKPCPVSMSEVAVFRGEGMLSCSVPGNSGVVPYLQFSIRFKCSTPDGHIFTWPGLSRGHRLTFYIKDSVLSLRVENLPSSFYLTSNYTVQLKMWQRVMLMMTPSSIKMKLNDEEHGMMESLNPRLEGNMLAQHLFIGEQFFGQMNRLVINFKPVDLTQATPNVGSSQENGLERFLYNIGFESADVEENFISLAKLYLLPCPSINNWNIELALKPELVDGHILLMRYWKNDNFLLLSLEESRITLLLNYEQERIPNELLVNLHENHWIQINLVFGYQHFGLSFNGGATKYISLPSHTYHETVCETYFFVGDVSALLKNLKVRNESIRSVGGVLGYLKINGSNLDLQDLSSLNSRSGPLLPNSYMRTPGNLQEIKIKRTDRTVELKCPFSKRNIILNQPIVNWFKFHSLIEPNNNSLNREIVLFSINTSYNESILKINFKNPDLAEGFYSCQVTQTDHDFGKTEHIFILFHRDYKCESKEYSSFIRIFYFGTITLTVATLMWCLTELILHYVYS